MVVPIGGSVEGVDLDLKFVVVACLASFIASPVHAQAFGLRSGQAIEDLRPMLLDNPDSPYIRIVPPEPNDAFNHYSVQISKNVGLCSVTGGSSTDDLGFGSLISFRNLSDALQERYGNPRFEGATKKGLPIIDLGAAVRNDDLILAENFWRRLDGSDLPAGIREITLTISRAIGSVDSYQVSLYYLFDADCSSDTSKPDVTGL